MITRIGTINDIPGVLALQSLNLYANLSAKEREQGFVTTPFTVPLLEQIIEQKGLFVAEVDEQIIAYAFGGNWTYFKQWAIFVYMISRFPLLSFKGWTITTENSFQYGPVCIAHQHRGKGVLATLFETMRLELVQHYPLSITFINKVNQPSLKAHTKKLGWEVVDEFEFNDNTYLGLAFEMDKSVL